MRGLVSLVLVGFMSSVVSSSVLGGCGGKSGEKGPADSAAGADSGGTDADDESQAGEAGTVAPTAGGVGVSGGGGRASGAGGAFSTGGRASGGSGMVVSGGAPSAGNFSAAGAPEGGEGPTMMPSEPLVVPPRDCRAFRESVRESSCDYDFGCGGEYYYARCERRDDGVWDCGCDVTWSPRFEIEAEDGAEACSLVARACTDDEVAVGESNCERTPTVTTDTCTVTETCGPELDFGSGRTGRQVQLTEAWCEADLLGNGRYDCRCDLQTSFPSNLRVSAPSPDGVCEAVLDYCKEADGEPEFDGPWECVQSSGAANVGGCEVTQLCAQSFALAEGVELLRETSAQTICPSPTGGVAACYCTEPHFAFDLPSSSANLEACVAASQFCLPDVRVEPTGEPACSPSSVNATPGACESTLECKQSVLLGSTAALGYGYVALTCTQASASADWSCLCYSGSNESGLELDGELTSWEACTEAGTRCPAEVEVVVGPPASYSDPGSL